MYSRRTASMASRAICKYMETARSSRIATQPRKSKPLGRAFLEGFTHQFPHGKLPMLERTANAELSRWPDAHSVVALADSDSDRSTAFGLER